MRNEIQEPGHWKTNSPQPSPMGAPSSARRQVRAGLSAEAVDAAFADTSLPVKPDRGSRRESLPATGVGQDGQTPTTRTRPDRSAGSLTSSDLVQNLSAQLAMLETQREQLQHLLQQAQQGRDY